MASPHAHVWRLFGLLLLGLLVFLGAQRALRPASYGELGNYRAGSLDEILAQPLMHQGREVCGTCHEDVLAAHQKDVHFRVNCEDCHGPGRTHVAFYTGADDAIDEASAAMPKEYTLEGCLFCHRQLAARPRNFPQIDPVEHYRFLHVSDAETPCIACHSPHEPLFLLTPASEARLHPIIFECNHCHQTAPQRSHREVADHPAIFECRDCHAGVVKDAETRRHASLRCTACHLFHQENETAGRIYKNGNRRFCLLCHEQRPFKDGTAVPLIAPAEHLESMGIEGEAADDPRICLTCHQDTVHEFGVER